MKSKESRADNCHGSRSSPEATPSVESVQDDTESEKASTSTTQPLYCLLSGREKVFTICVCSLATLLGPLANTMYLPAIGSLASDLHVSTSKMYLTLTTFTVVSIRHTHRYPTVADTIQNRSFKRFHLCCSLACRI